MSLQRCLVWSQYSDRRNFSPIAHRTTASFLYPVAKVRSPFSCILISPPLPLWKTCGKLYGFFHKVFLLNP
ncbi:hypothetical protein NG799_24015 [Laspinema sp. D1]|uniref:Uncharacterized protein n=1 Tax=Laspinema palackyanum D2a TaxID=2953684 RepID=A0ABT2MX97_9CYAN|nr:hypothetical protein [Laspinema sp. D2a]